MKKKKLHSSTTTTKAKSVEAVTPTLPTPRPRKCGQSTSELGLKEVRLCLQDIGQILEFMCKYCMKPILLAQLRTHQLVEHSELLNDQRQEEKQVPEVAKRSRTLDGAKKTDERMQKSRMKSSEKNSAPKKRRKLSTERAVRDDDEAETSGGVRRQVAAVPSTSRSKAEKTVRGARGANEETRECETCRRPIPVSLFAEHLLTHCDHPAGKVWNCNLCEHTSCASRELKDHLMAKHYGLKGHICPNCSASFSWLRGLEEHSGICKQSAGLHKCEDCSIHFLNSKQLASHNLIHLAPKDGRVIQCKMCTQSFETHEFIQHLDCSHLKNCTQKTASKKHAYNCPMLTCQYQTWTLYVLREHVAYKHHGVKPYACDKCRAAFISMKYFRTHKKKLCTDSAVDGADQDSTEETHTCETCSRLISVSKFVDHLFTHCKHSPGKKFECNLCKYSSWKSRELKDHLTAQHYGMKRHICPDCKAEFSWLKGLYKHSRICKGTFKCNKCSKRFLNNKQLASHRQIHLAPRDKRIIQCKICTEKLENSEEFIQHLDESHLRNECGEKIGNKYSYHCPMPKCADQAWSRSVLREHVAYHHHGVEPYACERCRENFISMKRYSTHKKHPCSAKKPGASHTQKLTSDTSEESIESSDSENSDSD